MGENSYGTVMVVVVRCPTHLLLALRKRTDYLPVVTCCCWVSCFVTSGQSVRMDRNNKTDTGYADPRLLLPGSVTSLDHAIHQQCLTNTCGIAKKWKSNVFIISVLDLVGGCPLLYIFICEACDLGKKKNNSQKRTLLIISFHRARSASVLGEPWRSFRRCCHNAIKSSFGSVLGRLVSTFCCAHGGRQCFTLVRFGESTRLSRASCWALMRERW